MREECEETGEKNGKMVYNKDQTKRGPASAAHRRRKRPLKYRDLGFRGIYEQFCAFPLKDEMREDLIHYPGFTKADGILCYGYMHPEEGLMLAVMATGMLEGSDIQCFHEPRENLISVFPEDFEDEEIITFQESDRILRMRFDDQIRALGNRNEVEYMRASRSMTFIDEIRDPRFIDDVPVELWRRDLEPETVTVRITDSDMDALIGDLRQEPEQNFGVHEGDEIRFVAYRNGQNRMICYKDFDADTGFTAGQLEDGTVLKESIRRFREDRTEKNLMSLLHVIRDCPVFIPCQATEDAALPEGSGRDDVMMAPVIMKNVRDQYFLPVFSSQEEMKELADQYSILRSDILSAIDCAKNSGYAAAGIVVNMNTELFFIGEDLYPVLNRMESALTDVET